MKTPATRLALLAIIALAFSCSPEKKTEQTDVPEDTTAVGATPAESPAPTTLAFAPMDGYTVNQSLAFKDSINFSLITNETDLNSQFKAGTSAQMPDYIINWVVGVIGSPDLRSTGIVMQKAEVNGSTLEVYINLVRGPKQSKPTVPGTLFSIEKRDGVISLVFIVNGVRQQELMVI